jgi:hypothetical protein
MAVEERRCATQVFWSPFCDLPCARYLPSCQADWEMTTNGPPPGNGPQFAPHERTKKIMAIKRTGLFVLRPVRILGLSRLHAFDAGFG